MQHQDKGRLLLMPSPIASEQHQYMTSTMLKELASVKHFVVENIRSTRRLLRQLFPQLNIDELTIYVMDKHHQQLDQDVLNLLDEHVDLVLMSEAGCPCIADPGYRYVEAAHKKGYAIKPYVGPNSILLALMASGFQGQHIEFLGYLPRKEGELTNRLLTMQSEMHKTAKTYLFIEAPYRNAKMIQCISRTLTKDQCIVLASDLMSIEERIIRTTVHALTRLDVDYYHKRPVVYVMGKNKPPSF